MDHIELAKGFEIAYEVIEESLNLFAEEIYKKEIKFRSRGFGVNCTIELIMAVVEAGFVRNDPGDEELDQEYLEPLPPDTDTWMRSAIPVHKKFINKRVEKTETLLPSDLKSNQSFKTSFYRSNTMQRLMKKPSKIFEEPVPFPMEIVEVEISDKEEFIRLKKERDFKRKQEESERLENLKKEEENKRKLLARQFGGKMKNFTYDYNGKILIVAPPKSSSELLEKVEFTVVPDPKPEDNLKSLPRTEHGTRVGNERKKLLEPITERPFKQIQSLSILEHIRLAPGVTIGTSSRPLNSSRVPDSTTKSSMKKLQLLPLNPIIPPAKKKSSRLLESMSEAALSLPKISETLQKPSKKVSSTQKTGKKKPNQIKQYTKDLPFTDYPSEFDKFNLAILSDREWGKNPPMKSVKIPARVPKAVTAKDQWEIYGYLGKKPKDEPFMTSEELWQIASSMKKPRDRAYIEKVQHKTKNPPPPLGQSMLMSYNETS